MSRCRGDVGGGFHCPFALRIIRAPIEILAPAARTQLHRAAAFGALDVGRRVGSGCFLRHWVSGIVRLDLLFQLLRHLLGAAATRVVTATQERSAEAALHDHWAAALLAVDAGFDWLDRLAMSIHVQDVLALRITAAAEERSTRALTQDHRTAALFANMFGFLAGDDRLAFLVEAHRGLAIGIAAAGEELAALADTAHHLLAAIRAVDTGGGRRFAGRLPFNRFLLDVLALGIIRAAEEFAELAEAFVEDAAAQGAFLGFL